MTHTGIMPVMCALKNEKLIESRFEIVESLGSGGTGAVFKATDGELNRTVAIKILNAFDPSLTDTVPRFEREAKVLSQLRHEGIVQVYSSGVDDNGHPYIVMQYLEGETLGAVLRREGKLPWQRAVRIFAQLCTALSYAHSHGIIHRDLKPENVMLVAEPVPDTVKILDFGLSGFEPQVSTGMQKLTQTGAVVGSAYYLSPEVCGGHPADQRSDVYSLACVLYETLCGRQPYAVDDPLTTMYNHLHCMPPPFEGHLSLPKILELIVFKGLQKEPERRFQSMDEFCDALERVANGQADASEFAGLTLPEQLPQPKRGRRYLLLGGIALTAGLLAAVVPNMVSSDAQILSWQTKLDQGNFEWNAQRYDNAFKLYKEALSLAGTKQQKFAGEIALGRFERIPDANKKIIRAYLVDAIRDAGTEDEKGEACSLLGLLAAEQGDPKTTIAMLEPTPWERTSRIRVELYGRCAPALGKAYLRVKPPDYDKAAYWLAHCKTFERSLDPRWAPTDLLLAQARIRGTESSAEQKQAALATVRKILPLLSDAWDLALARNLLGDEEYTSILQSQSRSDAIAAASTIGTAREEIFPRPERQLYGAMLAAGVKDKYPQDFVQALQLKSALTTAADEGEIKKQLAVGEQLLQQSSLDASGRAVVRTCMGVAYCDLHEYDQALKYLAPQPWRNAGANVITGDMNDVAADCLAESYLFGTHPDPRMALKLVEPRVNQKYSARRSLTYGVALLQTAQGNRKAIADARSTLKDMMPYNASNLSQTELRQLRKALEEYGLMDLWK